MMKTKIVRAIIVSIGTLALLSSLLLLFYANMHIGHFLCIGINILIILTGIFLDKIPRWCTVTFVCVLLLAAVMCSVLFFLGRSDTATYSEDALIVLGAGIRGETPSVILRGRLDTALEYHKKNPTAVIVVSGGHGPQEDITEARAMHRYLTENGVPSGQIILEETATSSNENFRFSKALLDAHFESGYTVAFITNEYHIYRAEATAHKAGIDNITHVHSDTPLFNLIPNIMRECLAVGKAWIFG